MEILLLQMFWLTLIRMHAYAVFPAIYKAADK